ncbi:Methyltransferase domain-containing protein [Lentzea albidocapillata subsp. violacea]|uniref:Methyltransferase domain-containing protein n=1 Tax=Lentzea albidocapillata subsp. violacea TaxID=128104 RepID=A0A1G8TLW0_9PSEU|nr:class I SAM-dependent methyltransferase [Lentzea albidocapillata]SDJ41865.1 Methyltransferase domain-containing protein [Lentzea albidocapillata subsp. violacea]
MAEDRQTEIRGAFDAAAADFTALGRYLWEPIGTAAVTIADPRPGERVLDACCGTGASAIPSAGLVGHDGHVDAVDMSGPMIDQLRRLSADLPQLRAHQADVTAWTAESYDVVQSALGIFFFPDMTAGTDHLISRARPGGRAVFTIWRGESMAAAGRHLGRAIAEVTNTPPPAPRPPHLVDQVNQAGSYAAWLADRGLADVDVTVNEMALTMTPEVAWLVITGSGFRGALEKVPADRWDTVRELYLTSLRDDGVTELDATTLIGSGRRAT